MIDDAVLVQELRVRQSNGDLFQYRTIFYIESILGEHGLDSGEHSSDITCHAMDGAHPPLGEVRGKRS